MMDFMQLFDALKQHGPDVAEKMFMESNGGYNSLTGYGGQVYPGAIKGEQALWKYKLQNSPSQLQASGQMAGNAAHDQALAEHYANSAYQDQNPGPMTMQGLAALVSNLGQQQPFRNEPMKDFRSLFLALRGD